jgi:1-deoxy-D-xylulose-5-phosphate reductoisomerase
MGSRDFRAPDRERFPCLGLAEAAARAGSLACIWLNAADEVAVQAFLDKQLNFGDIPGVIDRVMERAPGGPMNDLNAVLGADALARERARAVLAERNVPERRTLP